MKLAFKLVATLMLGIAVVLIIHGYQAVERESRIFREELLADARRIEEAFHESLAATWNESGPEGVMTLIRGGSRHVGQLQVRWVRFDVQTGHPDSPFAPSHRLTPIALKQHLIVPAPHDDGHYMHSYWPVLVDGARQGGLEFARPTAELEQLKHEHAVRVAWVIASMFAMMGVLASVLGYRMIGRPLEQLTEKTRRVGTGDLTGTLSLRSRDELSELADHLNEMCRRLARSQQRVREETTARIAATEQLRHADRLQTVGQLSSGLAHELGTPLNVVSGRAELIGSGQLSADEIVQSADAIQVEAKKMTTIIRQLLDFGRRSTPRRVPVDLHQVVQKTVDMLGWIADKHQVTILVADAEAPATTLVDAEQIQQVLTNLAVNAGQAMPNGGTMRIAITPTHATPPQGCEAAEGEYFRIDVKDDGHGISNENLQRLFEPFFTTKDVGKGTGLGLSIAYGIVQENGGWIEVASELDVGSCFSVYLPKEARS